MDPLKPRTAKIVSKTIRTSGARHNELSCDVQFASQLT